MLLQCTANIAAAATASQMWCTQSIMPPKVQHGWHAAVVASHVCAFIKSTLRAVWEEGHSCCQGWCAHQINPTGWDKCQSCTTRPLTVNTKLIHSLHKLLVHLHAPHDTRLLAGAALFLTLLLLGLRSSGIITTEAVPTQHQGRRQKASVAVGQGREATTQRASHKVVLHEHCLVFH